MQSIVTLFGLVIFGAIAWALAHIVPLSGYFAQLEPMLVGQCERLDVAPGTEDVTIDPETGLVFVSAADRRAWYNETGAEGTNPANGVYVFALGDTASLRRITPPSDDFLPHGISLWRGDNGERRLFVINHPTSGAEVVEVFDASAIADGGDLVHLDSISFPEMHSPNDLVAVGPDSFYATNDRGYEEGVMAVLESYMALPFSSIVYYDGAKGRLIEKNLTYGNGINISEDGNTLYVAEVLKRRIALFERDITSGEITRRSAIKVPTGPDNVEVDAEGILWTAGHSRVFDFLAHAKDKNEIAPSHAVRIDPAAGDVETVFVSTEGEINGSSVAAAHEGTLIIGAVFDGHVMICPN